MRNRKTPIGVRLRKQGTYITAHSNITGVGNFGISFVWIKVSFAGVWRPVMNNSNYLVSKALLFFQTSADGTIARRVLSISDGETTHFF